MTARRFRPLVLTLTAALIFTQAGLAQYVAIPFTHSSGGGDGSAFINSGQCNNAAAASCSITSLSIPSGSIIVVGTITTFSAAISNPADSNSDTPTCDTAVQDSNAIGSQVCIMKAGATVTSLTCNQTNGANGIGCVFAWYSPGSLSGLLDQPTAAPPPQAQNNIQNWSSGTTATLAGSNDLVVDFWASGNATITSTYSDSTTQRVSVAANLAGAISDRNVSGTSAVTGTGTWSTTTFGTAHVLAVK